MHNSKVHRFLFIAFHLPPGKGSSGLQRALSFLKKLASDAEISIDVLTVHPMAYSSVSSDQLDDLPDNLHIMRSWAFDTSRHLSIRGRYFGGLAVPDNWISWVPFGTLRGLMRAFRNRPQSIWVTYPLATSLILAFTLSRLTGAQLLVDFRDPMIEQDERTGTWYPTNVQVFNVRAWIEKKIAKHARFVTFCTESARQIFLSRYPDFPPAHSKVIPNGFEEAKFAGLGELNLQSPKPEKLTLLHSGTVYPGSDRSPASLFEAIAGNPELRKKVHVRLRATGYDEEIRTLVKEFGLQEVVEIAPSLPYREALLEMVSADMLLLLQGYTSNPAIPAKAYEYLRAQRPILALVSNQGETRSLLETAGVGVIADIESPDIVNQALGDLVAQCENDQFDHLSADKLLEYSREYNAEKFHDEIKLIL